MIKKPTLFILLLAIVLGGGVYFYESKHPTSDAPPDTSKAAFTVQAGDIQSISLQHPGGNGSTDLAFEKRGEGWEITHPVDTPGDTSSVAGIADGIAAARITQTESGTPDRLKAYGLQPGSLIINFTAKGGAAHKIVLGDKDFTGENVYAVVDSGSDVALLPLSLLTSANKGLDDLRDHADLHANADTATAVELKNASGAMTLKKDADGNGWSLTEPENAPGDSDAISALVGAIASGKMKTVASETAEHLDKYGLASPAITVGVTDGVGKTATLLVGKKDGDAYFAKDVSRPTVFTIDADLYKKLASTTADFRDKSPLRVDENNINEIDVRDSNGAMSATRKSADQWLMQSPDDQKGKPASPWKVFTPVSDLHADEVIEKPSADVLAKLKTPAVEIVFTDKAGKKSTLRISKEAGDFVYAQSSEAAAVFKLKKQALSDLNLKAADFASAT